LLDIGRSGARSWRASRCFAAPASRAQSVQLPLARSLGRPQPLGLRWGAGNAFVAFILAQSVLGAPGFGKSLA